jgi:hypothetical protein
MILAPRIILGFRVVAAIMIAVIGSVLALDVFIIIVGFFAEILVAVIGLGVLVLVADLTLHKITFTRLDFMWIVFVRHAALRTIIIAHDIIVALLSGLAFTIWIVLVWHDTLLRFTHLIKPQSAYHIMRPVADFDVASWPILS